MKRKKGFTLIELIAVVAIMGIMAVLILPKVSGYSEAAMLARARADFTMVRNAIERYDIEHNTPLEDLNDLLENKADDTIDGSRKGPYISKIPDFLNGVDDLNIIRDTSLELIKIIGGTPMIEEIPAVTGTDEE
ncbi:type II secretion system protein G precursor [Oxobacter pfennigii]|uniref:Type II secretion system protein G n=1 Tax=Oxobacter pfennigii TaxID=36849 RepID=A0A0P8WQV6_9CLOT|nr:type II secretion system protein G precursor [Oxobacter pfennigii]